MRGLRGGAVALALVCGAVTIGTAERPASAMLNEPGHVFGLGGSVGSGLGLSLKLWTGGPFAFQAYAGLSSWYYGVGLGFRTEVGGVWHFPVARWTWGEMVIGPGLMGGIAWYQNRARFPVCGFERGDACAAVLGHPFFHWSILFHEINLDVFAEPGLVLAVGIPGSIGADLDWMIGARYYF